MRKPFKSLLLGFIYAATIVVGAQIVVGPGSGGSGGGGGGGVWGSITGTLSNQTDLQSALDAKAPLDSPNFLPGDITLGSVSNSDGSTINMVRDASARAMLTTYNSGGTLLWFIGTPANTGDYILADDALATRFRFGFDNVFSIKDTGTSFAATDGVRTDCGLGNGNDECLTWDFDNAAANTVAISTSTGVNQVTLFGNPIAVTTQLPQKLTFNIGTGLSTISTGFAGCTTVPVAGTIVGWSIISTDAGTPTSGAIVIDLWEDTQNNYPPTDADSITSAAPPTITATNSNAFSTTLTSWQTALVHGLTAATQSIVCANVDSVTSLTQVNLSVFFQP